MEHVFIHFRTVRLFEIFAENHRESILFTCCDGKGCAVNYTTREARELERAYDTDSRWFSPRPFAPLVGQIECPVCFIRTSDTVKLKCNHRFCTSCIQMVYERCETKTCPLCRGTLEM